MVAKRIGRYLTNVNTESAGDRLPGDNQFIARYVFRENYGMNVGVPVVGAPSHFNNEGATVNVFLPDNTIPESSKTGYKIGYHFFEVWHVRNGECEEFQMISGFARCVRDKES